MFQDFHQVEAFFENRKSLGIKPGLDRIKNLLHLVNNPQHTIPAIHVAGTNGKGSTVQFIKNALLANGYRVGVFISPSFEGLPGHIVNGDTPIAEETFLALCNEIYPAIIQLDRNNMSPTEFEIITALAFMYFSKYVDIALIEAGMGGRGDTTNCFHPIMSIITNVEMDHTNFLGDTLKEIAYHKAGIIKRNAPVVIGEMDKGPKNIIEEEARSVETNIYQLGHDFIYTNLEDDSEIQCFSWCREEITTNMSIRMYGKHQVKNASIAYMGLMILNKMGYTIDSEKALEAIKNTQVLGRFETIQREPLIIIDGAHNPAGIQSFLETVLSKFGDKEKHLILAVFKDKELDTMLEQLSNHFSSITLTSFDHPRAASAEDLYALTHSENKYVSSDWKEAVTKMEKESVYFITGSLHFISRVRAYILGK